MSALFGWIRKIKQEWAIPVIVPDRCVHSHCEVGSCTHCVDSCPQQAWILDDDSLHINTEQCDGCGLCVAACPESALEQTLLPLRRVRGGNKALLFACERLPDKMDGEGVIPCLHTISYRQLLQEYRAGYQQVIVSSGDCGDCPRSVGQETLPTRIDNLNTLLASRAAPPLAYQVVTGAQWQHYRRYLKYPTPNTAMTADSRRQFLRQALTLSMETGLGSAPTTEVITAWSALLPPPCPDVTPLYPFVPLIDVQACNGCDACAVLCPQHSIGLVYGENKRVSAYQLHPDGCTGCNVCVDSCDQQAIHINHLQSATQTTVKLTQAVCKACGNAFHYPTAEPPEVASESESGSAPPPTRPYCRICAHTQQHRQLFQVY